MVGVLSYRDRPLLNKMSIAFHNFLLLLGQIWLHEASSNSQYDYMKGQDTAKGCRRQQLQRPATDHCCISAADDADVAQHCCHRHEKHGPRSRRFHCLQ